MQELSLKQHINFQSRKSHEAEASMNFELWKAYLIKKSSGHKVTQ